MQIDQEWLEDVPELVHFIRRPTIFAANAFYWAMAALFALMQTGLAPLYWFLTGLWNINANGYMAAVHVLMNLGCMLLPVGVYILSRPDERESLRLRGAGAMQLALSAVTAGAGFLAANLLTTVWMLFLESIGLNASEASVAFSGNMALDLLLVAAMPAVCEELLFRGVIMGAYERRGTWKAIWISALLFAGLHGSVTGFPAQLLLGVVLGYAAASTGSLVCSMAIHGVYNAITVIANYCLPADTGAAQTVAEQLGGATGVAVLFLFAAAAVLLLLLAARWLDRLRIRADAPFGSDAVIEYTRMERGEIILLFSAAVTVIWFYVQDLLMMIG